MGVIDRYSIDNYDALHFPRHAPERAAFKAAVVATCIGGSVVIISLISLLGQTQTISACFAFLPKGVTYALFIPSAIIAIVAGSYAISGCVRRETIFRNYADPEFRNCVESTVTKVGKTYKGKGGLDLSYVDTELGFAVIVDGVGSKNPLMRKCLKAHFEAFTEKYSSAIQEVQFSNLKDAFIFFDAQMSLLENQFCNETNSLNQENLVIASNKKTYKTGPLPHSPLFKIPSVTRLAAERVDVLLTKPDDPLKKTFLDFETKPGMSFVQVFNKEDKLFLFTAQARTTMVIVENRDGSITQTQEKTDFGVGHYSKELLIAERVGLKLYDVTGAKRIIGLSSGIAEFMTWEEIQEVATTQSNSEDLFKDFKIKITSPDLEERTEEMEAANGKPLRVYIADKPESHDDLGLFVLDLN